MWKSILLGALVVCLPTLTSASESTSTHKAVYKKASYKKATYKKKPAIKKKAVRRANFHRTAFPVTLDPARLHLRSNAVLVFDPTTGESVYEKNADAVQPIASITKLMTALVVLENKLDLDEPVTIDASDVDLVKHTRSRLNVGTVIRRGDLMRLALMASENRAAAALGRAFPGGTPAFVALMNDRAAALGLTQTRFADSTGLSSQNVSSPGDLAKLVQAAYQHELIREYSTTPGLMLTLPDSGRSLVFNNTNLLVKNSSWDIGLQKTGFINESGQCLVMQTIIGAKPFVIVLLDAWGKYSRIGDANRIKKWLELRSASGHAGAT